MSKSKPVDLDTDCPCGAKLHFSVQKPKTFTPATTKVECKACKSVFLVRTKVGRKDRGVDIELGVQELSPKCEKILQKAIDDRNKEAAGSNGPGGTRSPVAVP